MTPPEPIRVTEAHPRSGADAGLAAARLLVLAKEPIAGRVKTRLMPEFAAAEAAALAAAALDDTLTAVGAAVRRLAAAGVAVLPELVLDGSSQGLPLPAGCTVRPQVSGGLDERLAAAFAAAQDLPTVLVGMDTPQATPEVLAEAVAMLLGPGPDACLGLATDGGWWLLGLRRPDPALLFGLPMSTPATGAATRARLQDAGLRIADLPVLRDVDTAADAAVVAEQAPGTRFAAVHDRLLRRAS